MELHTLTAYSEKSIPARSGPFSHSLSQLVNKAQKKFDCFSWGSTGIYSCGCLVTVSRCLRFYRVSLEGLLLGTFFMRGHLDGIRVA